MNANQFRHAKAGERSSFACSFLVLSIFRHLHGETKAPRKSGKHRLRSALAMAVLLAISAEATAGPILGPVSVSSPQGDFGTDFALVNIINQSGLSAAYTSGVTDFDSYVASTKHISPGSVNSGFTNTSGLPQIFSFDLGASATINAMAFWTVQNIGAVRRFELFADNDANYGNGTGARLGGIFSAPQPPDPAPASVFAFPATTTRYVHLNALVPPALFDGIGEIAFRQVPEPASITLVALGLFIGRGRQIRSRFGAGRGRSPRPRNRWQHERSEQEDE